MKDSHHETIFRTEVTHWWYKVRRKIIHSLIAKYFPQRNDLSILDVGCGTGALLRELGQYGKVQGLDFSPKAAAFCKERGFSDVQIGSAMSLPFPDATFDLVLALDIIEHVSDDRLAISELYRVTKPQGKVIIFVPTFMFLWGITDILSEHFRRYTRKELVTKVREAGFAIIRASYFNTFLFPPIALLRVGKRLLGIQSEKPDNELGSPIIDSIFYKIFLTESILLRFINFPFGVSAMVVCEKKEVKKS